MLFGCYRRGDANDPDTYVAAIAAVLARYDADLIREVTDPNTGIQTTEKYMTFMPHVGELKVYCETVAARRERIRKLGELPAPDFTRARLAPPEPLPGDLANVFVPEGHQRYARLVEWSKTADPRLWRVGNARDGRRGIWVSWDVWDQGKDSAVRRTQDEPRSMMLSEAALKTMRDLDAERSGNLPADQQQDDAA